MMASLSSLQQHEFDLRQRWHRRPRRRSYKRTAPTVLSTLWKYRATLSDGSVHEGVLDAAGKALLTGVPPGGAAVEFFREPTPVSGEGNVWSRWLNKGKTLDLSGLTPSPKTTK